MKPIGGSAFSSGLSGTGNGILEMSTFPSVVVVVAGVVGEEMNDALLVVINELIDELLPVLLVDEVSVMSVGGRAVVELIYVLLVPIILAKAEIDSGEDAGAVENEMVLCSRGRVVTAGGGAGEGVVVNLKD